MVSKVDKNNRQVREPYNLHSQPLNPEPEGQTLGSTQVVFCGFLTITIV